MIVHGYTFEFNNGEKYSKKVTGLLSIYKLYNAPSPPCSSHSGSTTETMALQLWEALKKSITAYTGLSPSTFFSVLCLGLTLYYMVSNLFGSSDDGPGSYQERSKEPEEKVQPLPPPVQLGDIADEELKQYDGSDKSKPLLMAIKGQIYDVSQSRYIWILSRSFSDVLRLK